MQYFQHWIVEKCCLISKASHLLLLIVVVSDLNNHKPKCYNSSCTICATCLNRIGKNILLVTKYTLPLLKRTIFLDTKGIFTLWKFQTEDIDVETVEVCGLFHTCGCSETDLSTALCKSVLWFGLERIEMRDLYFPLEIWLVWRARVNVTARSVTFTVMYLQIFVAFNVCRQNQMKCICMLFVFAHGFLK